MSRRTLFAFVLACSVMNSPCAGQFVCGTCSLQSSDNRWGEFQNLNFKTHLNFKGKIASPKPLISENLKTALESVTDFDFQDASLASIADYLRERFGLNIILDKQSLFESGFDKELPDISIRWNAVTLMDFLHQLSIQIGMDFSVERDSIVILTPDRAASYLWIRVYEVTDLISRPFRSGQVTHDHDSLIDTIVATISPDSWDDVGGLGSIRGFSANNRGIIVVSQTISNHQQIASVLNAQRRSLGLPLPDAPATDRLPESQLTDTKTRMRRRTIRMTLPSLHE